MGPKIISRKKAPASGAKMKSSPPEIDIESCALSAQDTIDVRKQLLSWYDANRRKLPWRGDPPPYNSSLSTQTKEVDPRSISTVSAYGTWVSEVMLQQTRVDTVIEYYTKWMAKFPDLKALAAASKDEVNSAWAGLGYYRRAACLHDGAKKCVEELNGELPLTAETLQGKIKGIGPYTAGAVSSIAYGEATPCVDGNVVRVFARLHAMDHLHGCDNDGDDQTAVIPWRTPMQLTPACWKLAHKLLDPDRPGDFNQSLMELGATICTPRSPKCNQCPIRSNCKGLAAVKQNRLSDVALYPAKAVKKASSEHVFLVCVISRKQTIDKKSIRTWLMVQRPTEGLLANQWEFPAVEVNNQTVKDEDEEADALDDIGQSAGKRTKPKQQSSISKKRVKVEMDDGACDKNTISNEVEMNNGDVWNTAGNCMLSMLHNVSFEGDNHDTSIKGYTSLDNRLKQLNGTPDTSPILHVFSHQKHQMNILFTDMDESKSESSPPCSGVVFAGGERKLARWMSEKDMEKVGITSCAKKILERAKSKQSFQNMFQKKSKS